MANAYIGLAMEKPGKPKAGRYPNNIRAIRDEKHVKQAPIYTALNISQSALSQLESGITDLSVHSALVISQILKCSPSELSEDLRKLVEMDKRVEPCYESGFLTILELCLQTWKKPAYSSLSPKTVVEIVQAIHEQFDPKDSDVLGKIISLMNFAKRKIA